MDLNLLAVILLTCLLFVVILLGSIDYRRKRVLHGKPSVSFIVPCYNDAASVEETIRSIRASYDPKRSEIIVVNDKSTDDSSKVLRALKRTYALRVFENTVNKGKARSLNEVYRHAKHDILFFVDADVILDRKVVQDILSRLHGDVVAVSAPYRPRGEGFLARMQEIEYNMLALLQGAHNDTSAIWLWGGCLAVRRGPFVEVGLFSENAIGEDMDLALKLRGAGYTVQQSFLFVLTHAPDTLRWWYSQKVRWGAGSSQNLIKHYKIWAKHPLYVGFFTLFSVLSVLFAISLARQITIFDNVARGLFVLWQGAFSLVTLRSTALVYGVFFLNGLVGTLSFSVFSLPYAFVSVTRWKEIARALYFIPFSILYYPVFSIVSTIGLFVGVTRYRSLARGGRAW